MNKLERYSLHSGLKISKSFVNDCFFPIVHEKYITFHAEDNSDSKRYDYLQEVIELISPALEESKIKILQIGKSKSHQFDGVYSVRGLVNFNQESFVIKNSLLHFGSDGYQIQLSSHHNTPFISLYSSDDSASAKPRWGDESNQILIDSPKDGKEPSHATAEIPKTINKISPFVIAGNILDLLKIKHEFQNNDLVHVGLNYHIPTVEVIPDFVPSVSFLSNSVVNIRSDLCNNNENLPHWAHGRRLGIIAREAIDPNILLSIRQSILKISVEMSDSFDEGFLKFLKDYMIPYGLFSKEEDSLRKYRLKYIDEEISSFDQFDKKSLTKLKNYAILPLLNQKKPSFPKVKNIKQ